MGIKFGYSTNPFLSLWCWTAGPTSPSCPLSFSQVDIANILWAFAKLKVDEGERLRPLLQQAEEQLDSYLDQAMWEAKLGPWNTPNHGGNAAFHGNVIDLSTKMPYDKDF